MRKDKPIISALHGRIRWATTSHCRYAILRKCKWGYAGREMSPSPTTVLTGGGYVGCRRVGQGVARTIQSADVKASPTISPFTRPPPYYTHHLITVWTNGNLSVILLEVRGLLNRLREKLSWWKVDGLFYNSCLLNVCSTWMCKFWLVIYIQGCLG